MYSRYEEWYDLMQVCENGHLITAYGISHPEELVERCTVCGARTLTQCKKCGADIRGHKHIPGVAYSDLSHPPEYCHQCGEPYPWAGKKRTQKSAEVVPLARIQKILKRFHRVYRQLRNRYSNRPTLIIEDEHDVQNLLHALLILEFDDIRPEEWTPSYAGAASRMDFLLKQEKIVIEAKKTSKGLEAKDVGEQLLIDIAKYQKHPNCKTLVCFIYDPEGRIGNPRGLKNDLEANSTQNLKIVAHIYP